MDAVHSSGFSVVEAISLTIFFLLLVASLPLLKRLSIALSDDTLKSFPHVGVEIGDHEQRRRYFLSHSKELYQAGYNQVCSEFVLSFHTDFLPVSQDRIPAYHIGP